ncbi:MAG: WecB/TagA/CpsF family glycosyltransferase [Arenicella sp.]
MTLQQTSAPIPRLPKPDSNKRPTIFGIPVYNESLQQAVNWIVKSAQNKQPVTAQFVNADCLNKAYNNNHYRRVLQRADHIFSDGSGVQLACRIMHRLKQENVNGTDLFPLLCKESQRHNLRIFLLGARPNLARKVKANMQRRYPGVNIVGVHNGYFDDDDTDEVIKKINLSDADILLVAFGAPLQELWIDKHRQKIAPAVCIGVGGLFDFYSGRISRAPQWLRRIGCEWLWRLKNEPQRLWKRYLIGNIVFVFRVMKQSMGTQS